MWVIWFLCGRVLFSCRLWFTFVGLGECLILGACLVDYVASGLRWLLLVRFWFGLVLLGF